MFEGGTRRGLRLGDQAGQGLDLRGEMGKRRVGRRRGQNGRWNQRAAAGGETSEVGRKAAADSPSPGPKGKSWRSGTWRKAGGGGQNGLRAGWAALLPETRLALLTHKETEAQSHLWLNRLREVGATLGPPAGPWPRILPEAPEEGPPCPFLPINPDATENTPGAAQSTCPNPRRCWRKVPSRGERPAGRDWREGTPGLRLRQVRGLDPEAGRSRRTQRCQEELVWGPIPAPLYGLGSPHLQTATAQVPGADSLRVYQHTYSSD